MSGFAGKSGNQGVSGLGGEKGVFGIPGETGPKGLTGKSGEKGESAFLPYCYMDNSASTLSTYHLHLPTIVHQVIVVWWDHLERSLKSPPT